MIIDKSYTITPTFVPQETYLWVLALHELIMSICTTTSTLLQYDHVYSCYCHSSTIWGYLCYIKDNLQTHTHKFMTLINDEHRLMMIIHELSDVKSLMKDSLTKQWTNLSDKFSTSHEGHASYKLNNCGFCILISRMLASKDGSYKNPWPHVPNWAIFCRAIDTKLPNNQDLWIYYDWMFMHMHARAFIWFSAHF